MAENQPSSIIPDFSHLFPEVEESSTLAIICAPADYSASVICRAIEDCDAHILNLNVSDETTGDGRVVVYLRINHRNAESVVRSVERFGYEALSLGGDDPSGMQDVARARANELLRILEI